MTERTYRFVLGTALVVVLYFHVEPLQYIFVALLLFEGLSGYRVPVLVSRLRYGADIHDVDSGDRTSRFAFEAERGMRLVFAMVVASTFFLIPAEYWFVNWLVAIALYVSGLVNFCPMVIAFRWLGFR
jgi:hypothetical protein